MSCAELRKLESEVGKSREARAVHGVKGGRQKRALNLGQVVGYFHRWDARAAAASRQQHIQLALERCGVLPFRAKRNDSVRADQIG